MCRAFRSHRLMICVLGWAGTAAAGRQNQQGTNNHQRYFFVAFGKSETYRTTKNKRTNYKPELLFGCIRLHWAKLKRTNKH